MLKIACTRKIVTPTNVLYLKVKIKQKQAFNILKEDSLTWHKKKMNLQI